jgi:hypothetical protein
MAKVAAGALDGAGIVLADALDVIEVGADIEVVAVIIVASPSPCPSDIPLPLGEGSVHALD